MPWTQLGPEHHDSLLLSDITFQRTTDHIRDRLTALGCSNLCSLPKAVLYADSPGRVVGAGFVRHRLAAGSAEAESRAGNRRRTTGGSRTHSRTWPVANESSFGFLSGFGEVGAAPGSGPGCLVDDLAVPAVDEAAFEGAPAGGGPGLGALRCHASSMHGVDTPVNTPGQDSSRFFTGEDNDE